MGSILLILFSLSYHNHNHHYSYRYIIIISNLCTFGVLWCYPQDSRILLGYQYCLPRETFTSQVGVVVISRASHLYVLGLSSGLHTWAEIGRSQSGAKGFSPVTLVFLAQQIQLSRQDLSRQAIKH